ncbi:hypothetical protein CWB89_10940 [Pseudoalteromonas piscicida]|uniref:Enoyl-CoA hydratase n=1 Tax=Pseudoalteromonas piscicida TaxID=43662 RepID=A0AAQ2EYJ0_PSEO7|nr:MULTISPECIES: enoyl-CoA-hydratase DpgB [Pseudoalteromonas]KJY86265.1 hypothetical protein TW75_17690 [Pseudoalteromonas piscicida]TMN38144.1 hypothetical protein CWB94_14815 [Pseudoalteromonas piscicida]TMN41758.1 hypothetical protein CWB95_08290 [Pseudoalteromonas piscicida]TMN47651.1 hypothetical protein CWB91_20645 [Pseudoalteromonas piscicida]TMN56138.1 hypothetical protein CWB92_02980 [Pseudoalteromonas piscicida]
MNIELDFISIEVECGALVEAPLLEQFNQALNKVEDAACNTCLLIKLTGNVPKHSAQTQLTSTDMTSRWEKVVRRVERCQALTLFIAEGPVGGVMMNLLLACDYKVAQPDLTFNVFNGPMPICDMTIFRLAHSLTTKDVNNLVLFGNAVGSQQALELGLLDAVVTDTQDYVRAFMAKLNPSVISDIHIRRRLIKDPRSESYEDSLGVFLAASDRAFRRN